MSPIEALEETRAFGDYFYNLKMGFGLLTLFREFIEGFTGKLLDIFLRRVKHQHNCMRPFAYEFQRIKLK